MKKRNRIISFLLCCLLVFAMCPPFVANASTSEVNFSGLANGGVLNYNYSYGTVFWTEETRIYVDARNDDNGRYGQTIKAEGWHDSYPKSNAASRHKGDVYAFATNNVGNQNKCIRIRMTNCARDKDGNLCDVLIKVYAYKYMKYERKADNLASWLNSHRDSYASASGNSATQNTNNPFRLLLEIGRWRDTDLAMFWFETNGAQGYFDMQYLKPYNTHPTALSGTAWQKASGRRIQSTNTALFTYSSTGASYQKLANITHTVATIGDIDAVFNPNSYDSNEYKTTSQTSNVSSYMGCSEAFWVPAGSGTNVFFDKTHSGRYYNTQYDTDGTYHSDRNQTWSQGLYPVSSGEDGSGYLGVTTPDLTNWPKCPMWVQYTHSSYKYPNTSNVVTNWDRSDIQFNNAAVVTTNFTRSNTGANANRKFNLGYSGTNCGICYVFASPYTFTAPPATKKVVEAPASEFANGQFSSIVDNLPQPHDTDGASTNTSSNPCWMHEGKTYYYIISQYVPNNAFAEDLAMFSRYFVAANTNTFEMKDTLPDTLKVLNPYVFRDRKCILGGSSGTPYNYLTLSKSGNTVTVANKYNSSTKKDFYTDSANTAHFIHLVIPFQIKKGAGLSLSQTTIENKASVTGTAKYSLNGTASSSTYFNTSATNKVYVAPEYDINGRVEHCNKLEDGTTIYTNYYSSDGHYTESRYSYKEVDIGSGQTAIRKVREYYNSNSPTVIKVRTYNEDESSYTESTRTITAGSYTPYVTPDGEHSNGTVTVDNGSPDNLSITDIPWGTYAKANETHKITVTPNEGYYIESLKIKPIIGSDYTGTPDYDGLLNYKWSGSHVGTVENGEKSITLDRNNETGAISLYMTNGIRTDYLITAIFRPIEGYGYVGEDDEQPIHDRYPIQDIGFTVYKVETETQEVEKEIDGRTVIEEEEVIVSREPVEANITTDENGEIEVTGLPSGTYTWTELTKDDNDEFQNNDDGYVKDGYWTPKERDHIFRIDEDGEVDIERTAVANEENYITIMKVDDSGETDEENFPIVTPLYGAVFAFYNESGEEVYRGKTNINGEIKLYKLPHGNYSYKEVEAPVYWKTDATEPTPYRIDPTTYYLKIDNEGTKRVDENGVVLEDEGFQVVNEKFDENQPHLPGAGGTATILLIIVGCAVGIVSIFYIFRRKRFKMAKN